MRSKLFYTSLGIATLGTALSLSVNNYYEREAGKQTSSTSTHTFRMCDSENLFVHYTGQLPRYSECIKAREEVVTLFHSQLRVLKELEDALKNHPKQGFMFCKPEEYTI